ncbi:MAG: lipoyl(octanoyl) transferase LipB [Bacteroidetes bacterium]|nr:lipoyl(octanoyl) transferase LipB [Bacteroidota bacterium]
MISSSRNITVIDLARTRYAEAWDLQHQLWELRVRGAVDDLLLFTEHEPVYTIGKGGDEDHVLADEAELARTGTEMFRIDRGGDVTFHGPGQIVGYPIIDLHAKPDLHRYLRDLEEVIIRTLRTFGIEGVREDGLTGVWVSGNKVAALGVKVSRWVTMHGFALNVSTDLQRFDRIIPCGIFHKGVTSMEQLLGRTVPMSDVREELTRAFAEVFFTTPRSSTLEEMRPILVAMKDPAVSPAA